MNATEGSIYERLEQSIGAVLCGRPDPCVPCRDAANRVVVHRKEVRNMLLLFTDGRCQACEDAPVGMTVVHDGPCDRRMTIDEDESHG